MSIGRIPTFLLQQTAHVEVYKGEGGTGPIYGTSKDYKCRCEPTRKIVLSTTGTEQVANARMFLEPDVEITDESRVIVEAVIYKVLEVRRQIGDGGQANHLEVMLQSGR